MANDITAPHMWALDTAAAVKAAGTQVKVLHVHYVGTTDGDDLILQEYDSAGTAKSAIIMKVGASLVQDLSFLPSGITLNGLAVGTIDHGTAYVMVGETQIPGAA